MRYVFSHSSAMELQTQEFQIQVEKRGSCIIASLLIGSHRIQRGPKGWKSIRSEEILLRRLRQLKNLTTVEKKKLLITD
jgi:hypothetical protein